MPSEISRTVKYRNLEHQGTGQKVQGGLWVGRSISKCGG